jgi:hypothetical protein
MLDPFIALEHLAYQRWLQLLPPDEHNFHIHHWGYLSKPGPAGIGDLGCVLGSVR